MQVPNRRLGLLYLPQASPSGKEPISHSQNSLAYETRRETTVVHTCSEARNRVPTNVDSRLLT
jgi:hypothetical protein